jgi:hypothetical protein
MRNKDIIKQYVNTGVAIPETQILKLNKSLYNSYFRKRILNNENKYKLYEIELMNETTFKNLIDSVKPYDKIGKIVNKFEFVKKIKDYNLTYDEISFKINITAKPYPTMNLHNLLEYSFEYSPSEILDTFNEYYIPYFCKLSYEDMKEIVGSGIMCPKILEFILDNLKENYETFDDFIKFVLLASCTQNTEKVIDKYKSVYPNFIDLTRKILSENHEWILRKMPNIGYHRNNVRMFFCKIYQTIESFKLFMEICDSPILVVNIFGSEYIEKIRNDKEYWKFLLANSRNKYEILEIKKN